MMKKVLSMFIGLGALAISGGAFAHSGHQKQVKRGGFVRAGVLHPDVAAAKVRRGRPIPPPIRAGHDAGWVRFLRMDRNRDGRISRFEMSQQIGRLRTHQRFAKLDINRDGHLVRSELSKSRRGRRHIKTTAHSSNRTGEVVTRKTGRRRGFEPHKLGAELRTEARPAPVRPVLRRVR